jgi:hypothetical protein
MPANWLKDFGFNALALPRRELGPLDVLLEDCNGMFSSKAGTLDQVLASETERPELTTGEPTGSIAQKLGRKMELKFGLSLLDSLLGGLLGSKLGAETSLQHAKDLEMTYEDVTQDSLPLLSLQAWMEDANIVAPHAARQMLEDEKLAVVTAVLRSAKLTVQATRDGGASIALDVPQISGIVAAEGKVASSSADGTRITFEGDEPIVFGFQAYVLLYNGGASLGLEEVRRGEGTADPVEQAWTADGEVEEIRDAVLIA